MLILPATFDLIGTALAKVGLMYTSVSVYQLVRSSVIVFCALFNVTLLGKKVYKYMWFGIVLIMMAMLLISSSSVLGSTDDDSSQRNNPLFGISMLLGSCCVAALQYVFEEKAMSDFNAPPLVLVGMEGLWGTILMWGCVFPWAYIIPGSDGPHNSLEDVFDSFTMISNSPEVLYCLIGFFVTVAGYNVCGILVTKLGSSMWHTILDNFRPCSVWITSLVMYHAIFHTRKLGAEPWTWTSWFELGGLLVLLVGSAIYQAKIKLSCFNYHIADEEAVMATVTPQLVACSPMLTPQLVASNNGILQYRSPRLQSASAAYRPQGPYAGGLPYEAPVLCDPEVKHQVETA